MNSLMNYGSDDELDDSGDEGYGMEPRGPVSTSTSRSHRKSSGPQQDDTNYDEVQMSLSEDSDSEPNTKRSKDDRAASRDRDPSRSKDYRRDSRDDDKYSRDDDRYSRDDDRYGRDDDRSSKYRDRDDKDDDRRSKDDERTRDRYRGDKDDDRSNRDRRDDRRGKSKDRDRSARDDRYSRDRRDKERERRRSRSKSRDRRRSRSPRRYRSRSRSRSRDRNRGGYKKFDRHNRDRFDNRNNAKADHAAQPEVDDGQPKDRFFMPGITGRFKDQIEKRKLLWQKGKESEQQPQPQGKPTTVNIAATSSKTTKVWETTTFAQDTDGKVANKFKRLMGIKTPTEGNKSTTEVLKKQEEMFSSMEAQYEVARTATHTMRGVGLGFGSYQR